MAKALSRVFQVVPYIRYAINKLFLDLVFNKSDIWKETLVLVKRWKKTKLYIFLISFHWQYICLAVCSQFGFSSLLASVWGRGLAVAHGLWRRLPLLSPRLPPFYSNFPSLFSFSFSYVSPHFLPSKAAVFLKFNSRV